MNRPDGFRPSFRLNQWLVRPDLNRIAGPDGDVQVEPRVMAVLLALADRPDEVVTRLELLDDVWGDTVVGEEILTRAISELRRLFGDSARSPRYIETIRNHGYRLIAPVVPVAEAAETEPAPEAPTPAKPAPAPLPQGRGGSWVRLVLFVLALVVLALAGQRLLSGGERVSDVAALPAAEPLTTFPGREYHPALAPDGTRVAFAWGGAGGGRAAIHVKQRNSETPLRLADEEGWSAWPAWSPDGQSVAFVQSTATGSVICTVPSLGGAVRRILPVPGLVEGLDWSPDGDELAFAALDEESGRFVINRLDLASLTVTSFAADRAEAGDDRQPRYGPAGARLAWLGRDRSGADAVLVADLDDPRPRPAVEGLDDLQGLAWAADGSGLYYGAAPAGVFELRRVPRKGGRVQVVSGPGVYAWNPTVARGTGDLVYEQVMVDQDLWRVRLADRVDWELEIAPVVTSTRWEFTADYRPDGAALAFVSARSGRPEIWLAGPDGASPSRLTDLGATAVANLRWSPDGARLACNAVVSGEARVLVVDAAGGAPQRVSTGQARELCGGWTADGNALLIGADDGQGWRVHRVPLDGGPSTVLTPGGGQVAAAAADGRTLYYTRTDRAGLWRLTTGGRLAPELVIPDLRRADRFNWRLRDGKVLWIARAGGGALLLEHDPGPGTSILLAELPGFAGADFAALPGADTFVFPRLGDAAGDLVLVRDPTGGPAGR